MHISHLAVENFRNLTEVAVSLDVRKNIVIGGNASGKTSFLEAIYYLLTLRSFRTTRPSCLKQHGKHGFRIIAKIEEEDGKSHYLGIEKSRTGTKIRYDNRALTTASNLARILPAIVIAPDNHGIIGGGPARRRRILDWGLFHVEQTYLDKLHTYYRLLRHRNSLLKVKASKTDVEVWDDALVEAAAWITEKRLDYSLALEQVLVQLLAQFPDGAVALSYCTGWKEGESFKDELERHLKSDRSTGFTSVGPHRADLTLKINALPLEAAVSRGQAKLFIAALGIAQGILIKMKKGLAPLVLVDDFGSELDKEGRERLQHVIEAIGGQAVIGSIDMAHLPAALVHHAKLFHVKQGAIQEMV